MNRLQLQNLNRKFAHNSCVEGVRNTARYMHYRTSLKLFVTKCGFVFSYFRTTNTINNTIISISARDRDLKHFFQQTSNAISCERAFRISWYKYFVQTANSFGAITVLPFQGCKISTTCHPTTSRLHWSSDVTSIPRLRLSKVNGRTTRTPSYSTYGRYWDTRYIVHHTMHHMNKCIL